MPANLLLLIGVQALCLRVVLGVSRRCRHYRPPDWPTALLSGAAVGAAMDLGLGVVGLFAYLPHGPASAPVAPHALPLVVLVVNVIASYGLAGATIALVPGVTGGPLPSRRWQLAPAAVLVGALGVLLWLPPGEVGRLVAWGVVILAAGELALGLAGRAGALLAVLATGDGRQLLRLWAVALCLGVVYELANAQFPFWVWLPGASVEVRPVVALFGYVVLLHPMAALYRLLVDRRGSAR